MSPLTPKATALILEFEGMDQPVRWPGEDSGVTLGHGFDLGYATLAQFREAWSPHLTADEMKRLERTLNVTGEAAHSLSRSLGDIHITTDEADEVFNRCTVPRWIVYTDKAFPGIDRLPPDAQGALLSLCFNRGTSMKGERRREMAAIYKLITDYGATRVGINVVLKLIAAQIRAMKRLWPNTLGLRRRRDAEAALIESCVSKPSEARQANQ